MIALWTPTARPGMDVACASVARQQVDDEIVWIVGDDLGRSWDFPPGVRLPDDVFIPKALTSRRFSLGAGHNEAIRRARELDADLLVFMMDYTWIPPDGVARFKQMAERHPHALLTGVAHTCADPAADKVEDPDGWYTIFGEPYLDKPQIIAWEDVRLDRRVISGADEIVLEPIRWEGNWAAIPRDALHDERLMFDERYDDFHSCDNIRYATVASVLGYEVWQDFDNVALRLPRRDYWPVEDRFKEAEQAGMKFHWGQDHGDKLEIASLDELTEGFYAMIVARLDHVDVPTLRRLYARLHPASALNLITSPDHPMLSIDAATAGFSRVRIEDEPDGRIRLVAVKYA